jgi:hypothetical protein
LLGGHQDPRDCPTDPDPLRAVPDGRSPTQRHRLRTTAGAYAGIDSRRDARHHQRLIDQALAGQARVPRADRAARKTKKPGKR